MTCQSIYLKSKKNHELKDISDSITKNVDAFNNLCEFKEFNNVKMMSLVLDTRYARISDFVCIVLHILEQNNEQFVELISYNDSLMFDFGSNKHFLSLVICQLKELGFEEV